MSDQNIFLNHFSYTKWIITLLLGFSAGVLDVSFFYIIMGIVMWILYRCWKPSTEPSAIKCQDKAKEQAKVPHKVTDREFERLRYLQVLVNNSWPYITKYLEKFLRWRIQPLIRSRFKYLTNFHFFDIDFGNKAPQVTHMRVQSDPEKKQILLDLKISLNAAVMVNVGISKTIMAGVKSVKLEGTLRIILAPLIPDVPFTEAVNIYFPRRPVLHLQWTGLTNLLNIPGLHTMTERMIVDQIANFMVAPKFFTQPLAANFDMKNLPFADPWNALRIHVLEARNLVANDFFSKKSDPFVVVRGGGTVGKTRVISKNLNPQWNQTFEILFSDLPGQEIEFEVLDKNVQRDDSLGSCKIAVPHVLKKKFIDKWIRLDNVKSGELHIKVETLKLFSDRDKLEKVLNLNKRPRPPKSEELSSVALYTVIQKARGLPVIRPKKCKLNPLATVEVSVTDTVKRTGAQINSGEPEWKERLQFLIKDPRGERMQLNVLNQRNKVLGHISVSLSTLMAAKDMTMEGWFPLESPVNNSEIWLKLQLMILAPRIFHVKR
ncbi:extended synaptotagmin-1-like [Xenopus laevis]|uniref:Extended synaptotagmin-1-like n=1 Tax=Xenopus laevis TaxID=8355 RepID=A0A8J1KKE9_XENLA|nr:extended synaptotagmin-1-like [Xenopus laevis]XP_041417786.1 extended synaptotagmin-1-like [Xenopus laevis]XP_041417787.1 extended synaptotagmin-1-like [Xenopus laevis]